MEQVETPGVLYPDISTSTAFADHAAAVAWLYDDDLSAPVVEDIAGQSFVGRIPLGLGDPWRGQHLRPAVIVDHIHSWRFYGLAAAASTLFAEAARKLASWDLSRCRSPYYVTCADDDCDAGLVVPCNSTDATVCEPCELRYRKQVRTVVREPMFLARKDSLLLLTLTAPGAHKRHCLAHTYGRRNKRTGKVDRVPSYKCFETHPGEDHVVCPCAEVGNALHTWDEKAAWNRSSVARWNDLVTDIRRSVPGFADLEYVRTVEAQKRGVVHFHIVIRLTGPHFLMTTEHLERIRTYAVRHGFGHEVDLQMIGNSQTDQIKAARYVAKYVSKAKGEDKKMIALPLAPVTPAPSMSSLVSVDIYTGEVFEADHAVLEPDPARQPNDRMWDLSTTRRAPHVRGRRPYVYRTWFASRAWGLSLSSVRAIQRVFAAEGQLAAYETQMRLFIVCGLVDEYDGLPPSTG